MFIYVKKIAYIWYEIICFPYSNNKNDDNDDDDDNDNRQLTNQSINHSAKKLSFFF